MSKQVVESRKQFSAAKIGKDMYPYLKRYQTEIFGDETTSVRSINQLHIGRKLCYLFIRVRDNHIPMLSELAVTLKTMMNQSNSPRDLTSVRQGLFKTYRRLIDKVIPLTIQASPIFASDATLSNSEEQFQSNDDSYKNYFVNRIFPYINSSNRITELNLETPDEFYDLLALDNSPGHIRDFFPCIRSSYIPIDSDLILSQVDDSSCKEIIFDAPRFLNPPTSLKQENEDIQESLNVTEEEISVLESITLPIVESVVKPKLSSYFEKITKILNSRCDKFEEESRIKFDQYKAECDAKLAQYEAKLAQYEANLVQHETKLDTKLDRVLSSVTDVMSQITVKIPYHTLIPKSKFVDIDGF